MLWDSGASTVLLKTVGECVYDEKEITCMKVSKEAEKICCKVLILSLKDKSVSRKKVLILSSLSKTVVQNHC